MDTVSAQQEGSEFRDRWRTFVMSNRHVSWSYLPLWQEYSKLYPGPSLLADLSFLMVDRDDVVQLSPYPNVGREP